MMRFILQKEIETVWTIVPEDISGMKCVLSSARAIFGSLENITRFQNQSKPFYTFCIAAQNRMSGNVYE